VTAERPAALSAKAESVLRIARSIGGPFTRADCGIPRDDRPDCVMAELLGAGVVERAEGLRDGWLLWRLTDTASGVSASAVPCPRCAGLAVELAATQQMLDVMTTPEPVFLTHPTVASGWLYIGDHSPAFLAAVAAHLEAHEDLDVQEIGARIRAAGGAA
jgi:hypothetical protein